MWEEREEREDDKYESTENMENMENTEHTEHTENTASFEESLPLPGAADDKSTKGGRLGWRRRVFTFLSDPSSSAWAYAVSFYFDALVALSMFVMCAETVEEWTATSHQQAVLSFLEIAISANFAVDFVVKLSTAQPSLKRYVLTRATFWIDLFALSPFVLELLLELMPGVTAASNLKSLRVLRLLRFFRLGRIAYENFPDVRLFIQAIRRSRLAIAFLGMYVFGAGLAFAAGIYFAETSECRVVNGLWVYDAVDGAAPEPCSVQNMFQAWWFTLVTMTTVGYGDVVVRSSVSRILTVLIMITSLVFLALPAAIFAANLTEMYLERRLIKKFREHPQPQPHPHPHLHPVPLQEKPHLQVPLPVSAMASSLGSPVFVSEREPLSSPLSASMLPSQAQHILESVEQASQEINAALATLSTHTAFIQHQQQLLQAMLQRRQ